MSDKFPQTHAQEKKMRSLIVTAFMSLDGVMEAPGGEAGHLSGSNKDKELLDVVESETYSNGITTIVADVKR